MIYTVTLNPAIDLFINTNTLYKDVVNRTTSYDIQPNGKGVNVSFVLNKLGVPTTALGIGAGFTLKYIEDELTKRNIENKFIETNGITRINVFTNVVSNGAEYKLVNPGPVVNQDSQIKFLKLLESVNEKDIVCISGSFSKGISENFLEDIAKTVTRRNAELIVDTSYHSVLNILKYHPLLIKPNDEELKSWFDIGKEITRDELINLAQELVFRGAKNVLLSLGSQGAVFISKDKIYYGNAPKIVPLNTAGAGDTLLATFIAGMVENKPILSNLKYSIAAGSDTATQEWLTDFKNLENLEKQIEILRS